MVLTAGDVLVRCGIDVARVRRTLPGVEPFAVPVRVPRAAFRATWARGISAVTTPRAVYVTEDVYRRLLDGSDTHRLGPLMVHELTHLQQYRRLGAVRHLTRYVGGYLGGRVRGKRHWDAYRDISLEQEARQVAAGFAGHRSAGSDATMTGDDEG